MNDLSSHYKTEVVDIKSEPTSNKDEQEHASYKDFGGKFIIKVQKYSMQADPVTRLWKKFSEFFIRDVSRRIEQM